MTPEQGQAQADQLAAEAEHELIPRLVDWGFRAHALITAYGDDVRGDDMTVDDVLNAVHDADPDMRISALIEALSEIAGSFNDATEEQIRVDLQRVADQRAVEVNA